MTFPTEDQRKIRAAWFAPTTRSPRWLSIAIFTVALSLATAVSALHLVSGSVGVSLTVSVLFFLTGFAAFNFEPMQTRICVVSLWTGLGIGLLVGGWAGLLGAWLIFGFAAIAGAELLSRGISSIRDAAATDPLTGLQNRTGLWDECSRAITICRRLDQPLTLVHIDLDGFKAVNDREGHAEGDRILRLCAERWTEAIRQGDTLARIGGDEFLLVLPGSGVEAAARKMDLLRAVSPIDWCFGAAELGPDEELQECMDRADEELYAAKRARNAPR